MANSHIGPNFLISYWEEHVGPNKQISEVQASRIGFLLCSERSETQLKTTIHCRLS